MRNHPLFLQHIGLYAYRREFLLRLAQLPRTPLECSENLEQLRVLAAGEQIQVGLTHEPSCVASIRPRITGRLSDGRAVARMGESGQRSEDVSAWF